MHRANHTLHDEFICREATWMMCFKGQSHKYNYDFLSDVISNKVIAMLVLLFEDTQRYMIDNTYALDDSMRYIVYSLEMAFNQATDERLIEIIEKLLCIFNICTNIDKRRHVMQIKPEQMHGKKIIYLNVEKYESHDGKEQSKIASQKKQGNGLEQCKERQQHLNAYPPLLSLKVFTALIGTDVRNMICIALPDVDFLGLLDKYLNEMNDKFADKNIILHPMLMNKINILQTVSMLLRTCAYSDFYDGLAAIMK